MLCVSVKRNLIWISRTHLAKLDHCCSPKTNKRESIAFLVHKLVSFLDMDLIDHGHLVWLLTFLLLCLLHSHLNLCENHCDACIVFLHFAHHLPSVSMMCTHAVKLSIFPPPFHRRNQNIFGRVRWKIHRGNFRVISFYSPVYSYDFDIIHRKKKPFF